MKPSRIAPFVVIFTAALVLAIAVMGDDSDGASVGDSFNDGYYQYKVLNDHSVTLVKYTGSESVVNVPEKVSAYKVVQISKDAFRGNGLTKVVLPDTIVSVGENAFRGCTNLEEVSMGDAVASTGTGIFQDCISLVKVKLSISLTSLKMDTFSGCTSLVEIAVPEYVSKLETNCFKDCTSLRNINLENSSFVSDGLLAFPFSMGTDICSVNCGSSMLNLSNINEHTDDSTSVKHNEKTFTLKILDILDDPLVKDPVLRVQEITGKQCGSAIEIEDPPHMDGWTFKSWNTAVPAVMPAKDLVLTATWKVNVYSVLFCFDEERSQTRMMEIPYNSTRNLEPNSFVNDHGVFCGWAEVPKGPVVYADGAPYHMSSSSNVELYAVWKADFFLSFDPNGGSGTMIPQPFIDGVGRLIKNNSFEMLGHTFAGWAESSDGPILYADGANIVLTSDKVLYAKWVEISYDIVFEFDNGTAETYVLGGRGYSEQVAIPGIVPVRAGYCLIGWSALTEGGKVYKAGDLVTQLPYSKTSAGYKATLHAVWGNHILTVTYHNSVDENTRSQIFSYDTNLPWLSKGVFEYKFHTFLGWATVPSGEVVYVDGADMSEKIDEATDSDKTLDLYARWEVSTYKVVYDPGAGEGQMDPTIVRNYEEYRIADCGYLYAGHHFVEWRIIYSDGSFTAYKPGDVVTNLSDGRDHIVLNAIWAVDGTDLPTWVYLVGASVVIAVAILAVMVFLRRP